MYVIIDTLKEDTDCFPNHVIASGVRNKAYMHAAGFLYVGKFIIRHIESSRTPISFFHDTEEGRVSVSGNGILCFEPTMALIQNFSFAKTIKYRTTYEDNLSVKDEPTSFWDSTFKPILV